MNNNTSALWDSLWVNVNLATMDSPTGYGEITDAALAIQGSKIAWIGKMSQLPHLEQPLAKNIHEGQGRWITPGLIDCHTHLVYGGHRAKEFAMRLEGATYAEIAAQGGGILNTVQATRTATHEELFNQSARRLQCLLKEGVTTIEIKSGYGLDLDNECKMLQVARALGQQFPITVRTSFLGAHALPPEFTDKKAYIQYLCDKVLPYLVEKQLVDAVDGFCETIAFSTEEINTLFETAKQLKLPVKLHAEQLSNQQGAELAARYGALSADHLEYLSHAGAQAMAKAGTVAVLPPGAFYYLQMDQKPPIDLLRLHQVPIAIATDSNPGSSPIMSLLLMLNMGCLLFGLTPTEALAGVTKNAAKALGLFADIGSLAVGKYADMVIWDIEHPAELSYYVGLNPCVQVIKAGRCLP